MRKPLIVGQALPLKNIPSPLYPAPNSAGARLMKFMGLEKEEYLEMFERINVVDFFPGRNNLGEDLFPGNIAKERAARLMKEGILDSRKVFFLGKSAAASFGHKKAFFSWEGNRVAVPHPSGRNRFWNTPENRDTGMNFFRQVVKDVQAEQMATV